MLLMLVTAEVSQPERSERKFVAHAPANMASIERTWLVSHPPIPEALKSSAARNMLSMLVTLEVSQPARSVSNDSAASNMKLKSTQLLVSQPWRPRPTKSVAPEKALFISVTLDVSQAEMSSLNVL